MWLFMLSLAVAPPSTSDASRHAALMNSIEKRIVMPANAARLNRYSRFYARSEPGQIMGVYVRDAYEGLAVGKRRWMRSAGDLPAIADGGCYVVTVIYIPGKMKAPKAWCNGYG